MNKENKGFSLIELVIVIVVFLILIIFGLPRFLQFLEIARFRITGISLVENYKRCRAFPESTPIIPNIPKVSYQYQTCNDSMSANINNKCNLEINLLTGKKNNWPESFSTCNETTTLESDIASNNVQEENKNTSKDDFPPRNKNGEIIFDGTRNTFFAFRGGRPGYGCNYEAGRLKKADPTKPWIHKSNHETSPTILLSGSHKLSLPKQAQYTRCQAVEVPANYFIDGILPKPFEVKRAKYIGGNGLPNSRYLNSFLFNEEGKALMVVPPEYGSMRQMSKRYHPTVNWDTLTDGID